MKISLLFPFILLVIVSCSNTYRAQNKLNTVDPQEVKIEPLARLNEKTDRFILKSARQNGDILIFDVSYSGGCETHDFELITTGKYKSTYPPEIEIMLSHNNHNDGCRSVIDKKLYFNLIPLQYTGTNRVLLVVKNTNKTLEYNY